MPLEERRCSQGTRPLMGEGQAVVRLPPVYAHPGSYMGGGARPKEKGIPGVQKEQFRATTPDTSFYPLPHRRGTGDLGSSGHAATATQTSPPMFEVSPIQGQVAPILGPKFRFERVPGGPVDGEERYCLVPAGAHCTLCSPASAISTPWRFHGGGDIPGGIGGANGSHQGKVQMI